MSDAAQQAGPVERRSRSRSLRLGIVHKVEFYVGGLVLALGTFLALTLDSRERTVDSWLQQANETASLMSQVLGQALTRDGAASLEPLLETAWRNADISAARVLDPDGRTLADFRSGPTLRGTPAERLATVTDGAATAWRAGGRVMAFAPVSADGERLAALLLAFDRSEELAAAVVAHRLGQFTIAAFLLLTFLLTSWIVHRELAPLRDLVAATRRVSTGDLRTDVQVHRADEVGELATAFNSMVAALRDSHVRRDELEALNRDLEESRRNAETSARAKTEFLANMSHEIRTPMTAILGFAELLQSDAGTDEERSAARTIHDNGRHLLALLDDILDLSKFEAGRMTIERLPVDPARTAQDVGNLLRIKALERRIDLTVEIAADVPPRVRTDPKRLRQILFNLVGNAIKFTEHGSVTIRVELEARTHPEARLCLHVEDTGIGMTPQQRERLFESFAQADATTTRRFGGTGLGLALSQRFARALGGEIDVQSASGVGSTFTLRLPVTRAELDAPREADDADHLAPQSAITQGRPLAGQRVLVGEDGADNRRLIEAVVRRAGGDVVCAENGRLAVHTALAAERTEHPFDLVLMDVQMPEMDGYTATRALRTAGFARPIVALTAHALRGERQRCLEAGCDAYESKPLRIRALVETLSRLTRKTPPPATNPGERG